MNGQINYRILDLEEILGVLLFKFHVLQKENEAWRSLILAYYAE